MRAYRGTVQNGKIELEEGVQLPEGATVTITVGEGELIKATIKNALGSKPRKARPKLKAVPTP